MCGSDQKLKSSCLILILASFTHGAVNSAAIQKRQVIYAGHAQLRREPKGQDLNKVPGRAGVDYPIFHTVPDTNFHCGNVPAVPGIYANIETGCQAYHVCHDGREGHQGATFLCTNGTLFNQQEFTCDWWYNVNCAEAPAFYSLNLDPVKNPYAPKPTPGEPVLLPVQQPQHLYGRK